MPEAVSKLVLEILAKAGDVSGLTEINEQFEELTQTIQELADEGEDLEIIKPEVLSDFQQLEERAASAREKFVELARASGEFGKEVATAADQASSSALKLAESIGKAAIAFGLIKKAGGGAAIAKFTAAAKAGTVAATAYGTAIGVLSTAIAGLVALGIGKLAANALKLSLQFQANATELERLNTQFKAFSQTAEEAAGDFERIQQTADQLGVNFKSLTTGFLRLKAAAKGTSLEGKTLSNIFSALATTVRAVNLNAEQTKGAFFAVEQIISKNIVTAEELRRQLGDRIPGAFRIMADAIGVTTTKLDDMLEKGELLSEIALPAFAAQLETVFGPAAIEGAATLAANLERLDNIALRLADTWSKEVNTSISQAIKTITQFEGEATSAIQEFAQASSAAFNVISDSLTLLTDIFTGKWRAALADSLALVTDFGTGVASVLGGVTDLFFNVFSTIGEGISDLFTFEAGREFFQEMQEAVDTVTDGWVELGSQAGEALRLMAQGARQTAAELREEINGALNDSETRVKELRDAYQQAMAAMDDETSKLSQSITRIIGRIQLFQRISENTGGDFSEEIKSLRQEFIDLAPAIERAGDKLSDAERNAIRTTIESLGILNEELESVTRTYEDFSEETVKTIGEQVTALAEYTNAVNEAGDITTQQADIIVESAQKILNALLLIPEAQRGAAKGLQEELEAIIDGFTQFTSDAEKVSEKSLNKTVKDAQRAAREIEKSFEKMVKSLAKAFESIDDSLEKGFEKATEIAKDAAEEIDKAFRDELGVLGPEIEAPELDQNEINNLTKRLETLRNQAFLTQGELAEMFDLEDRISTAQDDLDDYTSAMENFSIQTDSATDSIDKFTRQIDNIQESALEKLQSLVLGEGFQAGFENLSESARNDVAALIENFERIIQGLDLVEDEFRELGQIGEEELGQISESTQQSVNDLANSLASIFEAEGIDTGALTGLFDDFGVGARSAGDQLRKLSSDVDRFGTSKEREKAKLDANNESLGDLSERSEDAARSVGEITEAVGDQAQALEDSGDSASKQSSALEALNEEYEENKSQIEKITRELGKYVDENNNLTDSFDELNAAEQKIIRSLRDERVELEGLNRDIEIINESTNLFQQTQKKTEEAIDSNTQALRDLEAQFGIIGEATDDVRAGLDDASDSMLELGRSGRELSGDVGTVEEFFERANARFREFNKLVEEGKVDQLGNALEQASQPAEDLADSVDDAAESMRRLARFTIEGRKAIEEQLEKERRLADGYDRLFEKLERRKALQETLNESQRQWNEEIGEGASLLEEFGRITEGLPEFDVKFNQESAERTSESIRDLGIEAQKLEDALLAIGNPLIAQQFQSVIDQLNQAIEGSFPIEDLQENVNLLISALESVGTSAQPIISVLSQLRDRLGQFGSELRKSAQAALETVESAILQRLAEDFRAVGIPASRAAVAINEISLAIRDLNSGAATIESTAERINAAIQSIASDDQIARINNFSSAIRTLLSNLSGSATAVQSLGVAVTELISAISEVTAETFQPLADGLTRVQEPARILADQLQQIANSINSIINSADSIDEATDQIAEALKKLGDEAILEAIRAIAEELAVMLETLIAAKTTSEEFKAALDGIIESTTILIESFNELAVTFSETLGPAIEKITEQLTDAVTQAQDLKAALDAVNETDLSNIIGQVNQLAQSLADALANAVALNQELNSVDGSLQEGQEFSGGNIPIGNTFESGVPLPFAGE